MWHLYIRLYKYYDNDMVSVSGLINVINPLLILIRIIGNNRVIHVIWGLINPLLIIY